TEVVGQPPRFHEQVFDLVAPMRNALHVLGHGSVVTDVRPHGIPAVEWFGDAVSRFFLFRLESAEHAIPNDQRSRVVLVNVFGIASVMDAMMRGCVKNEFYPSGKFADGFRVDPELIQGVEGGDEHEVERLKSKQRNRQVERKRPYHLQRTLPQGYGKVVFFAL